jgi:hypothetical protein
MRSNIASIELQVRAAEALRSLLGQVSVIKVKEMRREGHVEGRSVEILADTDVFGRTHLLACGISAHGDLAELREVLRALRDDAASIAGNATLVVIAPFLSPEAQQLCKENEAGFLDFEGNARLTIGEVFIGMRSLQSQAINRSPAQCARPVRSSSHRSIARTFSADRVPMPLGA